MAGLSLAFYLNQTSLRGKKILIIDREPKLKNDRTWAFWERGEGPFEAIVHRQWEAVWFHGPRGHGPEGSGFSQKLDLGGYRYKLLRGIDFYEFIRAGLAKNPAVEFLYSPILAVESTATEGLVTTEAGRFSADWVFDSVSRPTFAEPQHQNLLQHFKGWVVKTPAPAFDPAEPTMMDFRIDQHGECRFMYVLPFSETEALVEFTLFTPVLLPPEAYDEALKAYLRDFLNVTDFQILEQEFGIIPMSDEPTTERPGPRVLRTGTAGGSTRPSTGYTFARTQRRLQTLADNLAKHGQPYAPGGSVIPIPKRYLFYDRIFLNVFLNHRHLPADIFTKLYQRNQAAAVFRFLDEENSFVEDLRVMWAVPKLPFTRAALDVLWHRLFG